MNRQDFWSEVFQVQGSVTPYVIRRVMLFTAIAFVVWIVAVWSQVHTGLEVAPYEIIGVVLALLLVLRTNAGYDRWYEARKLWGGIVNQSRNLGMIGAIYGPKDRRVAGSVRALDRRFFARLPAQPARRTRPVRSERSCSGRPEAAQAGPSAAPADVCRRPARGHAAPGGRSRGRWIALPSCRPSTSGRR